MKKKTTKPKAKRSLRAELDGDLELRNRTDRGLMVAHEKSLGVIDPERVQAAVELLEATRAAYQEECAKLKPNGTMPQRLIALAHLADAASDSMSAIHKTFTAQALVMRSKGKFEAGPCVVSFDLQPGRRTPAWKEIAIEKARALAQLKGKKFNEKGYVERVMDATEKSSDTYKAFIEVRD